MPGLRDPDRATSRGLTAIATASDLGEVVRRARRDRDLTQAELAARAHTGRRFISELEAGKPTLEFERMLNVCHVLGISLLVAAPDR